MEYYRLKIQSLPRVSFAATDRAQIDEIEKIADNQGYGTVRYVASGTMEIKKKGKEKSCMAAGDFCIIPPNNPYEARIAKGSVITGFSFFLDDAVWETIGEKDVRFEKFNNVVRVEMETLFIPSFGHLRSSDEAYCQLKRLIGNYDGMGEYINIKVACNALDFFVSLADASSTMLKPVKGKAELYCERIDEYISKNYFRPITMSTISDLLMMHENYIGRMYKNIHGITVMQHLRDVRLEKAKELLLTRKYTVEQIAKEVGFPNAKYFIRLFKKTERVTPGKYFHSFFGQRQYSYSIPELISDDDDFEWEKD